MSYLSACSVYSGYDSALADDSSAYACAECDHDYIPVSYTHLCFEHMMPDAVAVLNADDDKLATVQTVNGKPAIYYGKE